MKRAVIVLSVLCLLLPACVPTVTPCPPTATCAAPATCEPCPPTVTPEPAETATATPEPSQLTCVDPRFPEMGISLNIRPAARYKLIAAWGWKFGDAASAPACAQPWMGAPQMGADHNVFGVVVGTAMPVDFRLYWPDGDTVRSAAGWIDIPIYAKYYPPNPGPYSWRVDGGDEMVGLGLYMGDHWSFAGVWIDTAPLPLFVGRDATAWELAQ